MGFVWGVCDREVGVVCEAHQGGEEGVGCVGRVILLDCEGQGERHEKVQEGAPCSSLGDPAAWRQASLILVPWLHVSHEDFRKQNRDLPWDPRGSVGRSLFDACPTLPSGLHGF